MHNQVTIAGRGIRYLQAGYGDPLILLHAFPLNADLWRPQLEAPPPGWRLLVPDLRGFGPASGSRAAAPGSGSDGPALSMDDHARDVLAFMDHLGIDRAVIGGLSMGGYVLFAIYRLAPGRVRGMLLVDTRPQADTEEGRASRRTMQDLADREGSAGIAREMTPKLLGPETQRRRPDLVAQVRETIESTRPEAIQAALACMMSRLDSTALLPAIRCPVLIVVGADDGLTPPADSELMHRQIAGSSLTIIPGAGHISTLERPELFNAALSDFLAARFSG